MLTLAAARLVASSAEAEAKRLHAGGAIAIVDDGGHAVLVVRLDNTFPAAGDRRAGKSPHAATFRRPTRDFEEAIKNGRTSLLGVNAMTPLQGGVPIRPPRRPDALPDGANRVVSHPPEDPGISEGGQSPF